MGNKKYKRKNAKKNGAAIKNKSAQNEIKNTNNKIGKTAIRDKYCSLADTYKKKIIAAILIIAAVLCGFFLGRAFPDKKNEADVEENVSVFNQMLTDVKMSFNDGIEYIINDKYYNEETAKAFFAVMNGIEKSEIEKEHIKNYFFDLFIRMPELQNTVELVQKDPMSLVGGCEDKNIMNEMDFALLGTQNEELTQKSKGFYISQNDPLYSGIAYGDGNLKTSGCALFALVMAINYVTDSERVTINDALDWANANNMYEQNSGTRWSMIRNFPHQVSVKCREMYINSPEKLKNELSGDCVIITSMKKGHFTENGHIIVLTGINEENVSVLDSASIYRSLQEWNVETIIQESNNYFWKISL